jgi:ligand-binding sensor domain-containing protein/serine phosphatase RsbU (regulator of sigma subunit)
MKFSLLCFFICFSLQFFGQTYQFKVLSSENTNIYPYIYSIHQDSLGYLWIGTGDGLFSYDGNILSPYPLTLVSGDNFISASTVNNKGITYLGLNNGTVAYRINQKFYLIKETMTLKSTINQLQFWGDELWAVVQNKGLYCIKDMHLQPNPILLPNTQTYCFYKQGNDFLIGTSDGLYMYSDHQLHPLTNAPQTKINCIHYNPASQSFFIGTDDEGMVEMVYKNNKWKIIHTYSFINNIKDIIHDTEGNIWLATMGEGIYFYRFNQTTNSFSQEKQFTTDNGLPSMQIRKIFFDREKNLWIGSYGSGLFQYYESAFSQLLQKDNEKEQSFTACCTFNEHICGGTSEGKLYKFNINDFQTPKPIDIPTLLGNKITSLFVDNSFILWIGTEKNGLFLLDLVNNKIVKQIRFNDDLLNNISSIDGFGHYKCIGTRNGLVIINTEHLPYSQKIITTVQGLPHNYINQVLCDIHENVLVVTPTNVIAKYNLSSNKITVDKINISDDILKINALCFDNKNNTWLGTYGSGVLLIDTTVSNYTSANGLFSDYTYSIVADESGTIWVGHRQGISSIKGNVIRTFSKNIGLYSDCNPNAVTVDKNGSVWFGTSKGLLRYDFKKSILNKIPPTVLVNNVKINDIENIVEPFVELESGRYKIQFSFTGISLRESEGVTFQYMLEGYDVGWSERTTNRTVQYPRLDEGTYTFKVLAFNYDKVASTKPYMITIRILPPFYKRWWFILLAIVFLGYVFYMIIKIRERSLRRMEKLLKEKLDQRTREVVRQKELIEHKNKDITDSIQYAKRIQESILPSQRILHSNFPNSFILYMPRDIVSGDFYMFQEIEQHFMFICADATGHGVPGAFMSLISSTILKDIMHLNQVIAPSSLLYNLDKEISTIFNQEKSETQDGLDLAVCLLDKKNYKLNYSAAMRPLLVFRNNTWTYYKGNRYSIGFSKYHVEKVFLDTEIQLAPGDRFYMFTDGLPDQFSFDEYKLKVSGLIHWLEEMQELPMLQQNIELQKRFLAWKGDTSQIDDILLIGVEV